MKIKKTTLYKFLTWLAALMIDSYLYNQISQELGALGTAFISLLMSVICFSWAIGICGILDEMDKYT